MLNSRELNTTGKKISANSNGFFNSKLVDDVFLKYVILSIGFSYFYNLPVLKYSAIGNNEFRLYDVAGVIVIFYYYAHFNFINFIIKKIKVFNWLRMLLNWIICTLPVSFYFYCYFGDLMSFIQSLLYLFHFYVFYLAAVLLFILNFKKINIIFFINCILVFSICSCAIVILQNFGIIPFLWSQVYYSNYQGFLSGTLGPNKIVLGITSLIIFTLSIGVFLQKDFGINKTLNIITILLNIYIILIAGSRTTYVGLLLFLSYFAFMKTSKFLVFGLVFSFLSFAVLLIDDEIYNKIEKVVNGRVVNKVRKKEKLQDNNVADLYEDLGSGRSDLTAGNALYLLENPAIIPFGAGFNNWLIGGGGKSAHNMYLQVIKELGLVGFVFYFGWLMNFLLIDFRKYQGFSIALKGLVVTMLITLYFGEHLYIFRPVFALLGLFLFVTTIFISILHNHEQSN